MSIKRNLLIFLLLFTAIQCRAKDGANIPQLPGSDDGLSSRRESANDSATSENEGGPPPSAPTVTPPSRRYEAMSPPGMSAFRLASGLQVLAVENHDAPVFTLQLAVRAGTRDVSPERVGLEKLVGNLLLAGTRKKKQGRIEKAIRGVGGEISVHATYEATVVTCRVHAQNAKVCLSIVGEIASQPLLPKSQLANEKAKLIQLASRDQNRISGIADTQLQSALWGKGNVRGALMSASTLGGLTHRDVVRWYQRWFRPNNALVAVSGSFETKKLRTTLNREFASWRRRPPVRRAKHPKPQLDGLHVVLIDEPAATKAEIRIGQLGLAHGDDDFAAMVLLKEILGGPGRESRLEPGGSKKKPAAAGFSARLDKNEDVGAFVVVGKVKTELSVKSAQHVMDVLGRLSREGPSQNELDEARLRLVGKYELRVSQADGLASAWLASRLHGLSDQSVKDYRRILGEVTVEQAQKIAAKRISNTDLVLIFVGVAKNIELQLKDAGWTYTKQKVSGTGDADLVSNQRVAEGGRTDPASIRKAKKILDLARDAKGLSEKTLKSFTWTGRAELESSEGVVPAVVKKRLDSVGRMRLDMSIDSGKIEVTTVVTEQGGWVRQKNSEREEILELSKDEADMLRAQIWRDPELVLGRHLEPETTVAYLPARRKFFGKPVDAVRINRGLFSVVVFIGRRSRMLEGIEYEDGGLRASEVFSKYRKEGGVKIANKRVARSEQTELAFELKEIQLNPKIPPFVFLRPKANAPRGDSKVE